MDFDPKKNYYDILWVSESASVDEIKKAFRKLAIKHHPDRWWSKEKFQEINEAYQVLSDEKKRGQYDAFRKWWFTGWFGWWQWGFDFWNFWGFGWFWNWESVDFDIWDLLGGIFWGWFGWGWAKVRKWEDLKKIIEITFEESVFGCKKDVEIEVEDNCPECDGEGGHGEEKCSNCNGSGYEIRTSNTILVSIINFIFFKSFITQFF